MNEIKHFRVVKKPRRRALWKMIPGEVWEALGEGLMKIAGDRIKSKIVKVVVIGVVAAATKIIADEGEE